MANLIPVEGNRRIMSSKQTQAVESEIRLQRIKEWFREPGSWIQAITSGLLGISTGLSASPAFSQEKTQPPIPKPAIHEHLSDGAPSRQAFATLTGKALVEKEKSQEVLPPPLPSAASFTIDSSSYLSYPQGSQEPFEIRNMPVSPFIDEGRTFLPVREIAYALGLTDKEIVWNGETRTITLTHGVLNDRQEVEQVTVTMRIGEKTITINGKDHTIDVPPRIKDDRSFFPARFIVEAFGGKIAFDPDTKTVRIASQTSELPELPIGPERIKTWEKIKLFLAGGEYMKPEQFNNYSFTHKEATVVLSSKIYKKIKNELEEKGIRETQESVMKFLQENPAWKNALESNLNDKNTVFLSADEGYVFTRYEPSPPGDSEWKYKKEFVYAYDAASQYLIKRTDNLEFQGFRHAWHDELGVVSDDGIRTAHRFHKQAPTGEEMEQYIMHGAPLERMKTRVKKMFEWDSQGKGTNVFGLDPKEVKHYLETGNADGFKSFTILPDAEGNPAVILVTGGKYGLKYNVESMKEAFRRLNEVDPKIIKWLVEIGLNIITGDSAIKPFMQERIKNGYATYEWFLGSIFINELKSVNAYSDNPKKRPPSHNMFTTILEQIGSYFINPSIKRKNKLYPDDKIFIEEYAQNAKYKWILLNWLPRVSGKLTKEEATYFEERAIIGNKG